MLITAKTDTWDVIKLWLLELNNPSFFVHDPVYKKSGTWKTTQFEFEIGFRTSDSTYAIGLLKTPDGESSAKP